MTTFKTLDGTEYSLHLNYSKARAIKESLGLDFVDLPGVCDVLIRLKADKHLLMKLLWFMVEQLCQASETTQDQFNAGFGGETFQAAREALAECAINFSEPEDREQLRTAIRNLEAILRGQTTQAVEKLATSG